MNIVYLIGNGFDLNLGMETGYRDFFYKYYLKLPKDNEAKIVRRLKDEIADDIESWSNFELNLGKFLDEKVTSQEAVILYNNLIDHLRTYIETEEKECFKEFVFDNKPRDIFCEYLCKPYTENRLLFAEMGEIEGFMLDQKHNDWDVKIITFNYTQSIEKLLNMNIGKNIQIGETPKARHNIILSAIEHIHGFTKSRLVLGVNDISQIANNMLRTDPDVISRYIKINRNNKYYLKHDEKCQQWINNANLVCLFGLSFGETDKRWWDMVSNVFKKNGKIVIFAYWSDDLPDENHIDEMDGLKNEVKDSFLSRTTISEDSKEAIKKDMYVVFNTKMFNFDKLKKRIETNPESV
jgi:hypothetical protein